jgi:hypothetical protein
MSRFCKLPDGVPRSIPPRRDPSPFRIRQPVTGPHLGYVPRTLGLQSIQRKQDRPDRSDILRVKLQVALRPTLPSCSSKHFKHADCRSPQCWRKSIHGISVARRTEGEKASSRREARSASSRVRKRSGGRARFIRAPGAKCGFRHARATRAARACRYALILLLTSGSRRGSPSRRSDAALHGARSAPNATSDRATYARQHAKDFREISRDAPA